MPDAAGRPVAAFDFDGTLTTRDTLVPFLVEARGRAALARLVVRAALPGAVAAIGASRGVGASGRVAATGGVAARDRAKEALLERALGGLPEADACAAARRTALGVAARLWRPAVVEQLCGHLQDGHRVLVVSASFEAWVAPAVAALGVHEVLASRWEVDGRTGRLTGRLDGPNVRGPRKATLVQEHLGPGASLDHAYGNSTGDRELLAMATHATWV